MSSELTARAIRADYERFLEEHGLTHEAVAAIVNNEADMVPMPPAIDTVDLRDSPIQGKGLFATRDLQPGDLIAPARIFPNRTPAGRFTNHSPQPNAEYVPRGNGDLDMVAAVPIQTATR